MKTSSRRACRSLAFAFAPLLLGASVVACGGGASNVAPPERPSGPSAEAPASDALPAPGTKRARPAAHLHHAVRPARHRRRADTRRADISMIRDLADEIGPNPTGFDVGIEIDAEALAKAP